MISKRLNNSDCVKPTSAQDAGNYCPFPGDNSRGILYVSDRKPEKGGQEQYIHEATQGLASNTGSLITRRRTPTELVVSSKPQLCNLQTNAMQVFSQSLRNKETRIGLPLACTRPYSTSHTVVVDTELARQPISTTKYLMRPTPSTEEQLTPTTTMTEQLATSPIAEKQLAPTTITEQSTSTINLRERIFGSTTTSEAQLTRRKSTEVRLIPVNPTEDRLTLHATTADLLTLIRAPDKHFTPTANGQERMTTPSRITDEHTKPAEEPLSSECMSTLSQKRLSGSVRFPKNDTPAAGVKGTPPQQNSTPPENSATRDPLECEECLEEGINGSKISLDGTANTFDKSYSGLELDSYNCSTVSSSSSCQEDPDTYFRMDAMDDSSGTSLDEQAASTEGFSGDHSSRVESSCQPSPSPTFAFPLPARSPRVLASSTPRKVFYPNCSAAYHRKPVSSEVSLDEMSIIKRLAASMPSSQEEQDKLMTVLESGKETQVKDDVLMIPRSQGYKYAPPNSWPSPVKRDTSATFSSPAKKALPIICPSPVKTGFPKPAPLSKVENDDDLSPHIVRDIGFRVFPLPGLEPSGIAESINLKAGLPSHPAKYCSPTPRRRLDKFFHEFTVATDVSHSGKETVSQRHFPLSTTRVRFRSEVEEAVYYLQLKYLKDPAFMGSQANLAIST